MFLLSFSQNDTPSPLRVSPLIPPFSSITPFYYPTNTTSATTATTTTTPPSTRVILIGKSFLDQIVHVPMLFSLLHWSQNIFCFLCSSTPSHVGNFFRLQWEFQWENDQNKKNGPKSIVGNAPSYIPIVNSDFQKKLPTWEGVELQRKQNVF